jgi:hypothetical protein
VAIGAAGAYIATTAYNLEGRAMPLPLALPPVALKVGQFALIAVMAWSAARHVHGAGPRAEAREAALDDVAPGAEFTRATVAGAARMDLAAATRRSLRLGAQGPGIEADLSLLARLRLRRIHAGS